MFLNIHSLMVRSIITNPWNQSKMFCSLFLQGLLRIHLVEGQNLVAKDNMMGGMVKGKSDPYAKIQIGGETFKSQVIKENLNPTWNEMYEVGILSNAFINLDAMSRMTNCHYTILYYNNVWHVYCCMLFHTLFTKKKNTVHSMYCKLWSMLVFETFISRTFSSFKLWVIVWRYD